MGKCYACGEFRALGPELLCHPCWVDDREKIDATDRAEEASTARAESNGAA